MRVFLVFFVLLSVLSMDISETFASRVFRRGRRLRYIFRKKRPRVRKTRLPAANIQISSLKIRGSIDKKKLQESIERRMKRILVCYKTWLYMGKVAKRGRIAPKALAWEGSLSFKIQLNLHGRATSTSWENAKKPAPAAIADCFLWNFRGRKFFPPQERKSCSVRVSFEVAPKEVKKKTKKKRRRR